MTNLEVANSSPRHRDQNTTPAGLVCPYCGQPVSRKEFEEIRARIETQERARLAEAEKALKARFDREQQQAQAKATADIAKAKKDATAAAQAQIKQFRAGQEAAVAQRVKAARESAEKKLTEAVAAERTKAYEDRMKLDAQLADLQRQLQRRTADELGQEGEIDLFEILRAEFSNTDKLARVPRGRDGADIIHDVVHNGAVVGRIIYDSKNHKRWLNSFTVKLRLDMVNLKSDHGILSSSVLPSGARQLHIQDGVIVAAPGRVVVLAHILRRQIIQIHSLRLGNEARDEKRDRLYDYIISDRCSRLLDRITSLSDDVIELDAKEESTHRTVWKRRAELIKSIQMAQNEFSAEIERIVSGAAVDAAP